MTKLKFLQIIKSIEPDKHIIADRRGSEENVKIKFVLPLLQFLGYDIIADMDFEIMSADIVLLDKNSKHLLVVETKAWEQLLEEHLDQCLEYTFKLNTPLVMITSGQQTAIYNSLINIDDLSQTEPIFEFSFKDLLGDKAEKILNQLYKLISKESLEKGGEEINKKVLESISKDKGLEGVKEEFIEKCKNFKSTIKTVKISEEKYIEIANEYSDNIRNALIFGKEEFKKIAQENINVGLRYRTKEIGLEYTDKSGPRQKKLGLVGLYPERAMIAFGLEDWAEILSSKEILNKFEQFPRNIQNKEQIEKLVELIKLGLEDIVSK